MGQTALQADRARQLVIAYRRGEQARAELAAALDPHAIYSELPDPPPVFMVYRGELVEIKPVSLYGPPAPAPPPAPPPPVAAPPRGPKP